MCIFNPGKKALTSKAEILKFLEINIINISTYAKLEGGVGIMSVIFLCGGAGKRLRPLTQNCPKALVEVAGTCLLVKNIQKAIRVGETSFYICAGYKYEKFLSFFDNLLEKIDDYHYSGYIDNIKINAYIDVLPVDVGTGKRLSSVFEHYSIEDDIYICYSDIYSDIGWGVFKEYKEMCMLAVPNRSQYGLLRLAPNNRIKTFMEKPIFSEEWINGGIFFLKNMVKNNIVNSADSFEKDILPLLVQNIECYAIKYRGVWFSMDSLKDFHAIEMEISQK